MRLLAAACVLSLALGLPARAEPAAATAGTAASPVATEGHALELAREIVRIGYPEDKRVAMFNGAADAMTAQMRSVLLARLDNDPAAKTIVERQIADFLVRGKVVMARHIPAFMDAYAQAYAHEFSVPELETILAFVKTPAGGHYFLRAARILSDPVYAAANADYMRELQPLIESMREQLNRELLEYFKQHPPKKSASS